MVPDLLRNYQDTQRILTSTGGPGWDVIMNRLRLQILQLVNSTFLEDTPWPWLLQLPRYMHCIRTRVDRLSSGGLQRELELTQDFNRYEERYMLKRKHHRGQNFCDPMLDHYRWMLEEFRVSLFAPKLGTAIKVSGGKLDDQWERVL